MKVAPKPENEKDRLDALRATGLLDSEPEQDFDELVTLAAEITETPIALVSLVDEDRQWFKARFGLDATETPRDVAFCAHAILKPEEVLSVPNALDDERFRDNPLVEGDPKIRAYFGVPIHTPSGQPMGTLCVIDQRPRTLSESQLSALRVLSRQVERILALHAARDRAEAESRAKSEFIAAASHEIRSPLHAVLGTLTLALDDAREQGLTGSVREDLEVAKASAERLSRLLDGLLDLSKAAHAQTPPAVGSVSVDVLFNELADLFSASAEARGNALSFAHNLGSQAGLSAHAQDLERVLTNLVSNAVKFTENGQVDVRCTTQDGERVRFDVQDTGVGIPASALDQVFLPFSRIANATGAPGSGLGLALARELVARMGGELRVESVLDVGTRFWFELPCSPGTFEPDLEAPRVTVPTGTSVLLVDDLDVSRVTTERLLKGMGLDVIGVASGREALEVLGKRRFDALLLDYSMPEMNGAELCRKIRSRYPDAAMAIGLTASAEPQILEECLRAGMEAVLTKPIDTRALQECLAEARR